MNLPIVTSIIALASFILSLINFRRERELKLLNKQTELFNKLTKVSLLSNRARIVVRELSAIVGVNEKKRLRAKEKLQLMEGAVQRASKFIDHFDWEVKTANLKNIYELEAMLQHVNEIDQVFEKLMNDVISLKEEYFTDASD
jgi:hypothetical protein